ncbi:hypothetical protein LENED_009568 [Lentinula edodes]|uniref:Uncharacterized protein n=1 Tax=Lentinula edodes TaxID=5353 RepID=A0A1Q3EK42_LENED|nr:hypothetical protein LENED_009568 [Lentinula edodes]
MRPIAVTNVKKKIGVVTKKNIPKSKPRTTHCTGCDLKFTEDDPVDQECPDLEALATVKAQILVGVIAAEPPNIIMLIAETIIQT